MSRPASNASLLKGLCSIAMIIIFWQALGQHGWFDTRLFPPPIAIVQALYSMTIEGLLLTDSAITTSRVLSGFAVGGALGFLVGLVTGLSRQLQPFVEPVIQIVRPIPAVSLVPLAIVWFGIGHTQKIFIIGWAAFFPIWVSTHTGVREVPRDFIWTAVVLGADKLRIVREVVIPWATPFIFAGTRISLAFAFSATVVSEMSGASAGLRYRVLSSHLVFNVDRMLAAILMIGLLGYVFDWLFLHIWSWAFPWLETVRRQAPGTLVVPS